MNDKKRIWITYSRADKAFVDKFVTDLKKNNYDVRNIRDRNTPGELLLSTIQKEIHNSDIILPIISKATDTSTWVVNEVGFMIAETRKNQDKKLIPIVIEKNANVPPFINQYTYADFTESKEYQQRFDNLLKVLELKRRPLEQIRQEETETLNLFTLKNNPFAPQKNAFNLDTINREISKRILFSTYIVILISLLSLLIMFVLNDNSQSQFDKNKLAIISISFLTGLAFSYLIYLLTAKIKKNYK